MPQRCSWLNTFGLERISSDTGLFYPAIETIDISPNPVDNVLFIRNPGEAVMFRLLNVTGQQVMNIKSSGQELTSMVVGHLYPGLYMLGAYDSDGKLLANARIIKN